MGDEAKDAAGAVPAVPVDGGKDSEGAKQWAGVEAELKAIREELRAERAAWEAREAEYKAKLRQLPWPLSSLGK